MTCGGKQMNLDKDFHNLAKNFYEVLKERKYNILLKMKNVTELCFDKDGNFVVQKKKPEIEKILDTIFEDYANLLPVIKTIKPGMLQDVEEALQALVDMLEINVSLKSHHKESGNEKIVFNMSPTCDTSCDEPIKKEDIN